MRIKLIRAKNYDNDEMRKLDFALDAFGSGINSVQFKDFILTHAAFDTAQNFSNQEIYDLILSGQEVNSDDGANEEADLELVMDGSISADAVGFTRQGKIFTHRNKFHEKSIPELAGHYAHEYCHLLDFEDSTQTGPDVNVPFQVGEIVERLAGENQRTFLPEKKTRGGLKTIRRTAINFNKSTIINPTAKKRSPKKKKKKATPQSKPSLKKKAVGRKKGTRGKSKRVSGKGTAIKKRVGKNRSRL